MSLKKRIIACLDIKNGRTVKGTSFKNLVDAGDPVQLAKIYEKEGVDELCFLDISATEERRKTLVPLVKEIAKEISIPFTVGGGIRSVTEAKELLDAGADKISVNSAVIKNPLLIEEMKDAFGSQCVVVAIDYLQEDIYIVGGKVKTKLTLMTWVKQVVALGAGELLLTSMAQDGQKNGFDIKTLKSINELVNVPIIASGGAGSMEDFFNVFDQADVSAALAASVFHFKEMEIPLLKTYLKQKKIEIRC